MSAPLWTIRRHFYLFTLDGDKASYWKVTGRYNGRRISYNVSTFEGALRAAAAWTPFLKSLSDSVRVGPYGSSTVVYRTADFTPSPDMDLTHTLKPLDDPRAAYQKLVESADQIEPLKRCVDPHPVDPRDLQALRDIEAEVLSRRATP